MQRFHTTATYLCWGVQESVIWSLVEHKNSWLDYAFKNNSSFYHKYINNGLRMLTRLVEFENVVSLMLAATRKNVNHDDSLCGFNPQPLYSLYIFLHFDPMGIITVIILISVISAITQLYNIVTYFHYI